MGDVKFTPGPWAAELGEVHEVRDAEGGRVCILTQLRGRHGLGGRRPDHESPANARLIAAAPEMYAALKAAEKVEAALILQWADFWDVAPQALIDALMDAQTLRNAALAKAGKP